MAGQQDLKNYTRLWNPILEAMTKAKLTLNQYKICLALFQRTYTWRKKETRMGYRDFEKYTGIKAKKIGQPFRQLVECRVIIEVEKPSFNSPGLYKFNKDIRQWSPEVLDINQITETNLLIVMEECDGTIPFKGTPPYEGDTPQNKGEDTPQNGGDPSPLQGDTKQSSNPCGAIDSEALKKYKENFKEKDDDDMRAREVKKIARTYEQEFGSTLSGGVVQVINLYLDKMDGELICEAIKRARIQGSPWMSYVEGILKKWVDKKVTNMAGVERLDREFEKRRKERQRDGPGKNDQRNAGKGGPEQGKKGKYAGLIPNVGG